MIPLPITNTHPQAITVRMPRQTFVVVSLVSVLNCRAVPDPDAEISVIVRDNGQFVNRLDINKEFFVTPGPLSVAERMNISR